MFSQNVVKDTFCQLSLKDGGVVSGIFLYNGTTPDGKSALVVTPINNENCRYRELISRDNIDCFMGIVE